MTDLDRADAYLHIPPGYARAFGGLRWSAGRDAVEGFDAVDSTGGATLAVAEEVGRVLEGVFGRAAVPPLAHVLHLLAALKGWPTCGDLGRLADAFARASRAAGAGRNAGRLVAELCRGLPPEPAPPRWEAVRAALRLYRVGDGPRRLAAVEPALTAVEFEAAVAARVARLTDADLVHWLTFGTGPTGGGEELAEATERLPLRVADVLDVARLRPRLVGAATLVPALDAALTVPPRRPKADAVPQGGYADVTTRGDPARLLPSQLALDPDEFVRRFAAGELLYFQREEPHAAPDPERIIVLDQGVRTWGSVRLALAAAALSLLKPRKKAAGPVKLATTSAGAVEDPSTMDAEELADLLEASDLTPHPGDALRRATGGSWFSPSPLEGEGRPAERGGVRGTPRQPFPSPVTPASQVCHHLPQGEREKPGHAPRDLILLTHPRALREPAVIAAAKGLRPADRLFALAVDEDGRAELSAWSAGGPVSVRTFRVDLAGAVAARAVGDEPPTVEFPVPRLAAFVPWTGDVEPVPFPFRPGLVAEPTAFGFDAAGEWAVMVGTDGVLHGLPLDGGPPEVLPRAFVAGAALKQVDAVLGVAGGVVVCGRLTPPFDPRLQRTFTDHVAAHYDRAARRVTLHELRPYHAAGSPVIPWWAAYPDLHCVTLRTGPGPDAGCALDLATRERYFGAATGTVQSRTWDAWERSGRGGSPPFDLPVVTGRSLAGLPADGRPYLHHTGAYAHPLRTDRPWKPFAPMRDGKPLLAGATIDRAVLAGQTLALGFSKPGERTLAVFRGPDGAMLGECRLTGTAPFTLSVDGRKLIRPRGSKEVAVSDTADFAAAPAVFARAGLHTGLSIDLRADPFRLVVAVGGFVHRFGWDAGGLIHARGGEAPKPDPATRFPAAVGYDEDRFPRKGMGRAREGLYAVTDRLGQVLFFGRDPQPVAAFLIRREKAAAWAGGAFWGDPALIGAPPTPNAARTHPTSAARPAEVV